MFETFSFLPPLTESEIANQVEYIISNGWTACLEFTAPDGAYIRDRSTSRLGKSGVSSVCPMATPDLSKFTRTVSMHSRHSDRRP